MVLMRGEAGRGLSVSWPEAPQSWPRKTVDVTPQRDEKGRLRLGVSFDVARFGAEGLVPMTRYALSESYNAAAMMVGAVARAVVGEEKIQVASIVRMTEVGADTVKMGYEWFFTLLALLSVNLGLINLFPFPALDGGRLMFVAVEGIARRPVPRHIENIVHAIGFVLLMGLVAIVVAKEIAAKF